MKSDPLWNCYLMEMPSIDWCKCGDGPVVKNNHCRSCLEIITIPERACEYPGCKETFQTKSHNKRYCEEHKGSYVRACDECGTLFNRTSNSQRYCKPCAQKVKVSKTKVSVSRLKKEHRCLDCGDSVGGNGHVRCDDCLRIRRRYARTKRSLRMELFETV